MRKIMAVLFLPFSVIPGLFALGHFLDGRVDFNLFAFCLAFIVLGYVAVVFFSGVEKGERK